jgi:hypothetical protein
MRGRGNAPAALRVGDSPPANAAPQPNSGVRRHRDLNGTPTDPPTGPAAVVRTQPSRPGGRGQRARPDARRPAVPHAAVRGRPALAARGRPPLRLCDRAGAASRWPVSPGGSAGRRKAGAGPPEADARDA